MDLSQEVCPFRPGLHRLRVIITDLMESEARLHQLAREEQENHPEDFTGKIPVFIAKSPASPL